MIAALLEQRSEIGGGGRDLCRHARLVVARVAERVMLGGGAVGGGERSDEPVESGLTERVVLVEADDVPDVGHAELLEVLDRGARLLRVARAHVEDVLVARARGVVAQHLGRAGEGAEEQAAGLDGDRRRTTIVGVPTLPTSASTAFGPRIIAPLPTGWSPATTDDVVEGQRAGEAAGVITSSRSRAAVSALCAGTGRRENRARSCGPVRRRPRSARRTRG